MAQHADADRVQEKRVIDMPEHVIIWARTLDDAKLKAKMAGGLKLDSGRLHDRGSLENSYRFEKA